MFATKISQNSKKPIIIRPINWPLLRRCINFNTANISSQKIETININKNALKVTISYSTTATSTDIQLWRKITSSQVTGIEANPSGNGYTETFHNDTFEVNNNDWLTFTVTATGKWLATISVINLDTGVTIDTFDIDGGNC